MAVSFRTCIVGAFAPLRELLRTILEDRGHEVRDYADPSLCPCVQGREEDGVCTFMLLDYSGGDGRIRSAVEKGHVSPADIAVLAFPNDEGVTELRSLGCHIIRQPFRISELLDWVEERERRSGEG